MPKSSCIWGKKVHTFPNDISQKVNMISRQEIELAIYDIQAQHVCYYTTMP